MSDSIAIQDIREALDKIIKSAEFSSSPKMKKLLKYIVDHKLLSKQGRLKEYSIAVDVLKKPESFDGQLDPIVRVSFVRLRKSLEFYYASAGKDDLIQLHIPKGSYEPEFIRCEKKPAKRNEASFSVRQFGLTYTLGLVTMFMASIAVYWTIHHDTPTKIEHFAGPRLLIQPFEVASLSKNDPMARHLAIGLSSELVTDMSQFPWLSVIHQSRGLDKLIAGYDSQTAPDYVLTGSVGTTTQEILVAVQLLEFPSLRIKWAASYHRPLVVSNIEQIQLKLYQNIASFVGSERGIVSALMLTEEPIFHDVDYGAFHCFFGMYAYLNNPSIELHKRERECLEKVVSRFPRYSEAWAALSYIYMDEIRHGQNPRVGGNSWEDARIAVEKALVIDPLNSIALNAAMTFAIDKPEPDIEAFRKFGMRDLELRPNNPFTLAHFGTKLGENAGLWDEGMRYHARAMDLNPDPPIWYYFAPAYYSILGTDNKIILDTTSRFASTNSVAGTILHAIAAHRNEKPKVLSDCIKRLSSMGIHTKDDARQYIENRRYESNLKKALKTQIAEAYQSMEAS